MRNILAIVAMLRVVLYIISYIISYDRYGCCSCLKILRRKEMVIVCKHIYWRATAHPGTSSLVESYMCLFVSLLCNLELAYMARPEL